MLTITFCLALCAAIALWPTWRRITDSILIGSRGRCVLAGAYWILTFTIVGDMLACLSITDGNLTAVQFKVLLALALGMMPQLALLALVITPIAIRGKHKNYSFTRALIFIEGCAVVSMIMLAAWLISILHYRGIL